MTQGGRGDACTSFWCMDGFDANVVSHCHRHATAAVASVGAVVAGGQRAVASIRRRFGAVVAGDGGRITFVLLYEHNVMLCCVQQGVHVGPRSDVSREEAQAALLACALMGVSPAGSLAVLPIRGWVVAGTWLWLGLILWRRSCFWLQRCRRWRSAA